jgi:hypothetical protein
MCQFSLLKFGLCTVYITCGTVSTVLYYMLIFSYRMIKAILIFNNHGKPRLNKFYQYYVSIKSGALNTVL